MQHKLEITKKLEDLGVHLYRNDFVAVLNMPTANKCEKRAEQVEINGRTQQACRNCVTQGIPSGRRLSLQQSVKIIDYFAGNYGTRFLTVNGRGDPFHPELKAETLGKIKHAKGRGVQSYVFTAGNNLDEPTCDFLACNEVNVMISLYGNKFIGPEFFEGVVYPQSTGRLQNQAKIAGNLRRLIGTYNSRKPEQGTRIGMNYVVLEEDLRDVERIRALQEAENNNRVFFVCNTPLKPHPNPAVQEQLRYLAREFSDFHISHSTGVNGQCQMGAGSSVTIDYDGTFYRCPYMSGRGDGNFLTLAELERRAVVKSYLSDRGWVCVMRGTRL